MLLAKRREHRISKNQVVQFFFFFFPKTTDSLCVSLFRSLSFNMCLSFLYLCLCLSLAPEFARRTTPSGLWDGYLPHKQPHLADSGLLQLSSLSSKPALCLCLSVRPSVRVCLSVCLSSSVGFSVSLSLFWIFLRNFATALKISF